MASATDAEILPETEPGTFGEDLIMPTIGSEDVAVVQWPGVWRSKDAFQSLNFGDGLLYVHPGSVYSRKFVTTKIAMIWITYSISAQMVEDPGDSGRATQCKIHYSFVPSMHDGVLYVATHLSGPPIDLPNHDSSVCLSTNTKR